MRESLYFVCRTYQRFTKAGVCTCHAIKEKLVTDAVLSKLREACQSYLNAEELLPLPKDRWREANMEARQESDALAVENKIRILTNHLDKAYMDKLSGLLAEADFERIYARLKEERAVLEKQLTAMKQPDFSPVKRQQPRQGTGAAICGQRLCQQGASVQPDRAHRADRGQTADYPLSVQRLGESA